MGYYISKLESLPNIFDWYFFLIGDYRNHSLINDFFRNDFSIIADRLGEGSAIIAQNCKLENQLQNTLKDIENGALGLMLSECEKHAPGLLIINKHPLQLNHFNEFMQNAADSVPGGWDNPENIGFLASVYNDNKELYEKLRENDVIIYIPFRILEKVYVSSNSLITDIVSFSKGLDNALIKKTSRFGLARRSISSSIGVNFGIISLNFDL